MINLITGLPGAGKTLWTLGKVDALAKAENRKVYYHGIPNLVLDWELLDSPEDWVNLPSNSIIVIDECQSTFRPRPATVKPPPYIAGFETHRHKGLDFFLLTQHPMLVDSAIRRLAGKHFHVVRFYGFQKSTIHEFQQVRDNVDKNLKNSISTHFIFPKDVFTWYKSADAHTIKRRVPFRMVFLLLAPFLMAGVIYLLYQNVWKLKNDPQKELQKINGIDSSTNRAGGSSGINSKGNDSRVQNSDKMLQLTYIQAHTPEIEGLPFTAPIYKDVVKPITAAYPAACIISKSQGCKCYSQQGTVIFVDKAICNQIVSNGFFIDWDTVGKTSQNHQVTESRRLKPSEDNSTNQPLNIDVNTHGLHASSSASNS